MRTTLLILALSILPALALPAHAADPCALGPLGRTPVDDYYVEQRANGDVWVYQETNGVRNLQRGSVSMFGSADDCVDDPLVLPDVAVF